MRIKKSEADEFEKKKRESETKGLVWKAGKEFYVSYTLRETTFGLTLENFGRKFYVPERTRITYSPFMKDSERTIAKEILEICAGDYGF